MPEEEEEIIEEEELEEEDLRQEIPPKIEGDEVDDTDEGEEDKESFKTFDTEEDYDKWREEELAKVSPPKEEKEEEEEEKPIKLYDGYLDEKTGQWMGEKPTDWNEFANRLLNNPQVVAKLQSQLVPATQKAIAEMSKQELTELEDINKGFDKEYDTLAKQGELPARDTDEGKKVNSQITKIGANHGQRSLTDAYKLWKKIPVSEGGGFDYTTPAKVKLNQQKKQAGKVKGSKGGDTGTGKKKISYTDVHNKSLSELVDEEME